MHECIEFLNRWSVANINTSTIRIINNMKPTTLVIEPSILRLPTEKSFSIRIQP